MTYVLGHSSHIIFYVALSFNSIFQYGHPKPCERDIPWTVGLNSMQIWYVAIYDDLINCLGRITINETADSTHVICEQVFDELTGKYLAWMLLMFQCRKLPRLVVSFASADSTIKEPIFIMVYRHIHITLFCFQI